MQNFLRRRPWVILAAGALVQLVTGVPASWGVFRQSVADGYAIGGAAAAAAFSVYLFFYGAGCVAGGLWQDKKGPRAPGLAGAALVSGGFFAAAFVPNGSALAFWACFAAPAGVGCALLTPAVLSCAQKWYAQRKGLATGVIGLAMGASGAFLTLAGRFFIGRWGVRTAFFALGALQLAVCGISAALLENPSDFKAPEGDGRDLSPRAMLRTKQYRLLTAAVALAAPPVLLFSPVIVELAQQRGLGQAGGLWCVVAGSAASAAGRLSMPWLSDRIGRKAADLLLYAALGGLSAAFAFARGWWVLAVYCALTFCYSGQAAVLPAAVTDLFGQRHAGVNYGFAALGMSAAALALPFVSRALPEGALHTAAAASAAAAFACMAFLKRADGRRL